MLLAVDVLSMLKQHHDAAVPDHELLVRCQLEHLIEHA